MEGRSVRENHIRPIFLQAEQYPQLFLRYVVVELFDEVSWFPEPIPFD